MNLQNYSYDEIVNNETVDINETRNYYGHNTIILNSVIIDGNGSSGGVSDITAQKEITLNAGFEVKSGGGATIYFSDAFPSCNNFNSFLRITSSTSDIKENTQQTKLTFYLQKARLISEVYPNPTQDVITLKIRNEEQVDLKVTVFNSIGQEVFSNSTTSMEFEKSFASLPKGVYYYEILAGQKKTINKFVVN